MQAWNMYPTKWNVYVWMQFSISGTQPPLEGRINTVWIHTHRKYEITVATVDWLNACASTESTVLNFTTSFTTCRHYVTFETCFPGENRHAVPLLDEQRSKFPKKFKNTSLNIAYKHYFNISMLTKHLSRVTACSPQTQRTASDPCSPGE